MDIREIQALHAQYSSQPVVIDINSHVRALPAPVEHESTRERAIARLKSTYRRFGRPTAIAFAFAVGAGLTGMCAAKLWHVIHGPQSIAHIEPTASQSPSTGPAQAAVSAAASAPPESKRPLTGADFAEPAERAAASLSRVDAQALRAAGSGETAVPANPATRTPVSDQEKAAASPIRASRATAGQQPAATVPAQGEPVTAASAAPTSAAAAPAGQATAQPKPAPRRIQRSATRQHHEVASAEAPAASPHGEPAKAEHTPKPPTPAKTGDVPLF
ncbi:hypothetical protein GR157_17040 [Burkholderia sp. 4701]|nr:hypothetical protein [Burkholderia sp. 4701]MXN83539.1 hypothetical protein [Burkholderia sp. 4812]